MSFEQVMEQAGVSGHFGGQIDDVIVTSMIKNIDATLDKYLDIEKDKEGNITKETPTEYLGRKNSWLRQDNLGKWRIQIKSFGIALKLKGNETTLTLNSKEEGIKLLKETKDELYKGKTGKMKDLIEQAEMLNETKKKKNK